MAHKRSLALEKEVAVTNANEKINELIKSSKLSWADVSNRRQQSISLTTHTFF